MGSVGRNLISEPTKHNKRQTSLAQGWVGRRGDKTKCICNILKEEWGERRLGLRRGEEGSIRYRNRL